MRTNLLAAGLAVCLDVRVFIDDCVVPMMRNGGRAARRIDRGDLRREHSRQVLNEVMRTAYRTRATSGFVMGSYGRPVVAAAMVVVVLSVSVHAAHSQGGCTSAIECSLNGVCAAGAWLCDRPWTGASCSRLAFKPVVMPQGYGMAPNKTTWGGEYLARERPWRNDALSSVR